jgi:hypothetical protein
MKNLQENEITLESYFDIFKQTPFFELLAQIGLIYVSHIHFDQSVESASVELERLAARYPEYLAELQSPKPNLQGRIPLNVLRKIVESATDIYNLKLNLLGLAGIRFTVAKKKEPTKKISSAEEKIKKNTDQNVQSPVKIQELVKIPFPDQLAKIKETSKEIEFVDLDLPKMSSWVPEAQAIVIQIYDRFLSLSQGLGIEGQMPLYFFSLFEDLMEKSRRLRPEHLQNRKAMNILHVRLEMFLTKSMTEKNILISLRGKGVLHKKYAFFYKHLIRQFDVVLLGQSGENVQRLD